MPALQSTLIELQTWYCIPRLLIGIEKPVLRISRKKLFLGGLMAFHCCLLASFNICYNFFIYSVSTIGLSIDNCLPWFLINKVSDKKGKPPLLSIVSPPLQKKRPRSFPKIYKLRGLRCWLRGYCKNNNWKKEKLSKAG